MKPGLRQRVLSEWYGYSYADSTPGGPCQIKEAVAATLAALGLSERLTESQVSAAWREIVGDFLADHSRPSRIQNGVLFVQVIQSSVRYELERTWKRDLVSKLRDRFGAKIREVRFVT